MEGPTGKRGPRGPPGKECNLCENYQKKIDSLESEIKKLKQMVFAMWDAPGMPGCNQITQEWNDL